MEIVCVNEREGAVFVARRQSRVVRNTPFRQENGPDLSVTMSTGVAFGPVVDFNTLVKNADMAMYWAKRGTQFPNEPEAENNRNQVWVYDRTRPEPR